MRTSAILILAASCAILGITVACKNPASHSPDKHRNLLGHLKEWPDSLTIERLYYGGMVPESESIRITADSCIAVYTQNQVNNTYRFALGKEELNNLLQALNAQHIDNITVQKTVGIIYDAPTHGIRITLGKVSVTLSNSASEEIDRKHQEEFRHCYDLIGQVVSRHNDALSRTICFVPDERIRRLPHTYLSIIPEGQPNSAGDSCHTLPEKICMRFWPGRYRFQVHLTRRGQTAYTEYLASTYPEFELQHDTLVHLTMPGDSVLVVN